MIKFFSSPPRFNFDDATDVSIVQVKGFTTTDLKVSSIINCGSADSLLKVRHVTKHPVASESLHGSKVVK